MNKQTKIYDLGEAEREEINARNVCAKLGIAMPENVSTNCPVGENGPLLRARAEHRTVLNSLAAELTKIQNAVRNKEPEAMKRHEETNRAFEYIAACSVRIQNQLDINEATKLDMRGVSTDQVRDTEGRRIGTLLNAADLRDEAQIAAKLGGNAQPNGEQITLADFVRGVAGQRSNETIRNALSEGTNGDGGYLVPSILMPGVLAALVPASSLLSAGANIAMLTTQAKSFSIASVNTIPTAAWRAENAAIAESAPTFNGLTITPQSLSFLFKVSRELLSDAPGLTDALQVAIAQALAKELDRAGLRGSGVAPEPKGLQNIAGTTHVTNGANGAALADFSPLLRARAAILGQNAPQPTACILSVRDDTTLAGLTDTLGQPLRKPDVLANLKLVTTTQIPVTDTVGTSTDCSSAYVADFTNFTFFVREALSIRMLMEKYADNGQIGFVAHLRADVAAPRPQAFAIVDGLRPGA